MNNNTEYKYKLPEKDGGAIEHTTYNNSIIIIGANGSGKSKLGAWMEQQDLENIHRVGAQRSLNFGEFINLKSREQAEKLVLYGEPYSNPYTKMKPYRWGNNGEEATTKLLDDYEDVLSLVIAIKNNQNDDFVKDCKKREANKESHNNAPETVIDKLQRIWDNIFPQREISFDDSKVTTKFQKGGNPIQYNGKEMSDGERVALYLIAQCLCVPKDKTIIIDEPEIHLHRSIMNKLWFEIGKERPDCLFIYITHDTQFAANHKNADKVWVKSYDGENWDLEKINKKDNDLPEQLLFDIIGSRKKILFCEGKKNSLDTKVYEILFPNYTITPVESCSKVIQYTRAFNKYPTKEAQAFGIIDRDFRADEQIQKLQTEQVYLYDVA